jgi:hypothetical protein
MVEIQNLKHSRRVKFPGFLLSREIPHPSPPFIINVSGYYCRSKNRVASWRHDLCLVKRLDYYEVRKSRGKEGGRDEALTELFAESETYLTKTQHTLRGRRAERRPSCGC